MPIGLIDDSWGGSACEAWITATCWPLTKSTPHCSWRWEELEKRLPQAKAEYESKLAEWKLAAEKAKAEGGQPPLETVGK